MENNLVVALDELKSALNNDSRVVAMKAAEQKLYEDPELIKLVLRKNDIEDEYQLMIKSHGENSEEAKATQKQLYEIKLALDTNPTAKAYNDAFIVVRDLTMYIDDILFGQFRRKSIAEDL